MNNIAQELQIACIEDVPPLEETPPHRPAPMPMQTLAYWTPRAIFRAMLRRAIEAVELRTVRRAAISVTHADEQG